MGTNEDIKRNENDINILFQKVNKLEIKVAKMEDFTKDMKKFVWAILTGIVVTLAVTMINNHYRTEETIEAIQRLDSKIEKLK